jgi:NAD-dependent SIR2 family protein deacetylase
MYQFLGKSLILIFIVLQVLSLSTRAVLLTFPPPISEEEVEGRIKNLPLEMRWEMGWETADTQTRSSIGFNYKEGKTTLCIQFEEGFPEMLASFEERFICSVIQGKKLWTFAYGEGVTESPAHALEAPLSLEEFMGIVHAPRVLENPAPQSLDLPRVIEHIREKQCVFYTGAGISATVIPTMQQLMEKLQLDGHKEKERFIQTVASALENPASYVQPMNEFYAACLYGTPTPAHEAIRDIAQRKNWGVLTENLDLLHQRSGIKPLHHEGSNWLRANVSEEDLRKIDYVITVGLASDESGFLGWYKAINPAGIIIAINLHTPNYLGAEDFLFTGDAQQLLPALREELF